jgi:hypothetical protein
VGGENIVCSERGRGILFLDKISALGFDLFKALKIRNQLYFAITDYTVELIVAN